MKCFYLLVITLFASLLISVITLFGPVLHYCMIIFASAFSIELVLSHVVPAFTPLHSTTIAFNSSHTHTQYDLTSFTHNIARFLVSQYDWSRIMESGETLKVRDPPLYLTSTSTSHLLSLTLSLLYSTLLSFFYSEFSSLYSIFCCPISLFRIPFFVFYCRLPYICLCLNLDLRPSFYLTSIFISFYF